MTVTLPLIGRFLARWWWLIVLPALAATAWTVATYPYNPVTRYGFSIRFSAGDSTPGGAGQDFDATYYSYLSSEYIVANLEDWTRTGDFATVVSEEMAAAGVAAPHPGLPGRPGRLDQFAAAPRAPAPGPCLPGRRRGWSTAPWAAAPPHARHGDPGPSRSTGRGC